MNKQELKKIIGTATCILDIGSYDGNDARELHDLFGCEVHCFEPNQEVFKHSEGLVYWPVAVGNSVGEAAFFKSKHAQSNSLLVPTHHTRVWPEIEFDGVITVPLVTLDSWWSGQDVDLIWADLNGSESEFIEGAAKTLKRTRYLYIEVSDKELYAGQPKINEIIGMMRDLGFIVYSVYDFGENFGNILFINSRIYLQDLLNL